jgi:hypothetical protein
MPSIESADDMQPYFNDWRARGPVAFIQSQAMNSDM